MKTKKLYLTALLGLTGLALFSCTNNSTKRNTTTPTGNLNLSSDNIIATAYNKTLSMNNDQFYTQLRYKGYDQFTTAFKSKIYESDIATIKEIIATPSSNFASLSETALTCLSYNGNKPSKAQYIKIRANLLENVMSSLCSSIYSTTSLSTLQSKTDKELKTLRSKYIDSQARKGITVSENDLKFYYVDDSINSSKIDVDLLSTSVPYFYNLSTLVSLGLLDSTISTQAEYLNARRNLYSIADKETIDNPDYDPDEDDEDDKTISNEFYLFEDDNLESTYDSSYKTFGEYNIVLIQFNSRREANETIKKVESLGCSISTNSSESDAKDFYLKLYNTYYNYKDAITSTNDDEFIFKVNEYNSELDDLSDSVETLVTDTLDNGDFLTVPRDIDDKYIMAYRISTTYDVSGTTEQTDYEDLTAEQKTNYNNLIKDNLVLANASSYSTTNLKNIIRKLENFEIYDPLFEYKFENSYSDIYDASGNFNNNLEFKFTLDGKEYSYTVEEFYNDAKNTYAASILSTYFEYEFIYKYYYESYMSDEDNSDTHDSNSNSLDEAIKTFEKNNNSTYPAEIGLETYLLNAYGYKTKDEVLKYYYDAKAILSDYTSKVIFNEWVDNENHKLVDGLDTTGILYNLLTTGNKNYSSLLDINLDHILINIDADGDGSPDDPEQFLANDSSKKLDFEEKVTKLAQQIYKEAIFIYNKYNTSMKDILTYIKGQYEEGNALQSDSNITWADDDFTKYNFLLTVESLGEIDQSSVENYVVPFATYVKNVYKGCLNDSTVDNEYDNGEFIIYDGNGVKLLTNDNDAESITKDTLVKTVYGYHLLVLNSYDEPDSTKYTTNDDSEGYQTNINLLFDEVDEDSDTDDIYAIIENSYNDKKDEVNFNQFIIYYVQANTSTTSTLDSDIYNLIKSMYDDVVSMYKNSDFQTYLLLELLDIQTTDFQSIINAEQTYYANTVVEYEDDSIYATWVDGSLNWSRPDLKSE